MIYGMMGLTGPRTAVRGNQIAAVGMAVAVIATLLRKGEFHGSATVWLILAGVVIGTVIGVPAARTVKMTAMPQMVALFNGVGGGAVALIAWVEFRTTHDFTGLPAYLPGTSLVAFGKLQEVLPGRPITLGRSQQLVNLLLLLASVACAVSIGVGVNSQLLIVGVLVFAA